MSENGCLCHGEGGHGGGSRRRSVLMFPTLSAATADRPRRLTTLAGAPMVAA